MIRTITEAAQNFCVHQIREEYKIDNKVSKDETFISYIDIKTNHEKKYRVYISSDKNFIQKISKIFLEEEYSDNETLIDMMLETTNLIVGSAKVIAEQSNHTYTIETPYFKKLGMFDLEYDQAKTININNDKLMIAIKEIDG